MHVTGGHHHGFYTLGPVGHSQIEHGADGLAGALGGKHRAPGAEQSGGILFALADDAGGLVQCVGPVDFGDVHPLTAQCPHALVTGHMEAAGTGGGVGADEIGNGGVHINPRSWLWRPGS